MAKPYSMDLRERVVAAVLGEGLLCHAAAARFGVAASSAIKWVRRFRETGNAAPGQMGGHKPNILSGPNREWLLERTATDFPLRGLVAELAKRGVLFLPPYGPDLNPIKQASAKLKHLIRKAAERSHEATWRRIGT